MNTTPRDGRFGFKPLKLVRGIGLLLIGVVVAGCPAPKAPDKVVIRGSNTIGEELAPGLIAAYKKSQPGVTFDLESKGTGYGFGNLIVGAADIAAASRTANDFEKRQTEAHAIELNEYIIATYSVAVVVNANNPVENLTREQVRDIFIGTVTNWNVLGGADAPIHLYVRDAISGTHLGFLEIAMEGKPYGAFADTFTNYAGIVGAVARDANGIGYSSIDLVKTTGAKGVTIGGVAPSAESVNKGEYPYARTLRLYTNKARETQPTTNFIQFILSPKGQEVVSQLGYVPRS